MGWLIVGLLVGLIILGLICLAISEHPEITLLVLNLLFSAVCREWLPITIPISVVIVLVVRYSKYREHKANIAHAREEACLQKENRTHTLTALEIETLMDRSEEDWLRREKEADESAANRERQKEAEAKLVRQRTEENANRREQDLKDFIRENRPIVETFFEIAERKVAKLDEYGDENWDALDKEIELCIKKLDSSPTSRRYDVGTYPLESALRTLFREYHDGKHAQRKAHEDVDAFTGVEFERYVADVLKSLGFDVRGTPGSGDQGADLIAKLNGRTVVIQVKRYQGAVGNRAVQEVAGAVNFYGGDEGWVITNSRFTPAARALAQKNNVRLIDGKELSAMRRSQ